ncbi:hypothetical protein [Flexithrix dorotheae]|uniref:hypothetical protein n=1 Tax=Flexithrix dorotheae TaxID=70993 RepID=UPI0003635753|nr:hypothetical protein [Flexithrix dorotheae]
MILLSYFLLIDGLVKEPDAILINWVLIILMSVVGISLLILTYKILTQKRVYRTGKIPH